MLLLCTQFNQTIKTIITHNKSEMANHAVQWLEITETWQTVRQQKNVTDSSRFMIWNYKYFLNFLYA